MKRVGILMSACVVCWLVAGARGDAPVKLPIDNYFLIKVATCNHAAIAIGKMAQTQGSPDVKAFADNLVKDHQASYDKVADLLKNHKVGVLSGTEPETKAAIKRLSDLKGADFDREYLKWVINEHRAGAPLFENQIKLGKEADVSAFAKESLTTCGKHLKKAEELAKAVSPK